MNRSDYPLCGRRCTSFSMEGARILLVQAGDGNDMEALDSEVKRIAELSSVPFSMVFLGIEDWNGELSPWKAPPVFGKEGFGDGAQDTLAFIEGTLVPDFMKRLGLSEETPIILGGYSLAAFFALWSAYRSDRFFAIAAASPSVWFPGWIDLAKTNVPKTSHIYLSLGDKEEKARNPVMATVGDCMRTQIRLLEEQGVDGILQWNEGNHFRDTGERCAKAFAWCLNKVE